MAGPQISTTEQPAPEGVTDFRPDEGGALPLADRAFQAQQAFSDPNFLREAATIAFKNRQPQGFDFLERSARVAKENGFEAVGHLLRGDGPAALSAFNRSGNFTDATGAKDNGDGTWTITRKSGATVQINPKTQIESYLNPREYATWRQHQDETAQRASDRAEDRTLRTRQLDIMKQQTDQLGKYQEGMNEARQTAAEAAEARAEAAGRAVDAKIAGIGGTGSRKSGGVGSGDYMKYRAKLRETLIGQDLRGAELDAEVERGMSADTTQIAPDPSNPNGFLLISMAGGNQMVIAPFDDFETAAAARASWVSGKGLPKKAAKPPVEDKGPYAPGEGQGKPPVRRLSGFDAYRQSAIDAQKPKPATDPGYAPDEMTRMMGGHSSAAAPAAATPTDRGREAAVVELRRLEAKAKAGKLRPNELQELNALRETLGTEQAP
jgi:hypothetical protein